MSFGSARVSAIATSKDNMALIDGMESRRR